MDSQSIDLQWMASQVNNGEIIVVASDFQIDFSAESLREVEETSKMRAELRRVTTSKMNEVVQLVDKRANDIPAEVKEQLKIFFNLVQSLERESFHAGHESMYLEINNKLPMVLGKIIHGFILKMNYKETRTLLKRGLDFALFSILVQDSKDDAGRNQKVIAKKYDIPSAEFTRTKQREYAKSFLAFHKLLRRHRGNHHERGSSEIGDSGTSFGRDDAKSGITIEPEFGAEPEYTKLKVRPEKDKGDVSYEEKQNTWRTAEGLLRAGTETNTVIAFLRDEGFTEQSLLKFWKEHSK